MEYKRICSNCNKELLYKSQAAYKLANKNNSLCRSCASKKKQINKHCADLKVLLEDTPEAFYWIGFLLADGSFYDNRLTLGLSPKDSDHLYKFAKFINYSGAINIKEKVISLACKDIEIIEKIKEKFDIKSLKTYNPPHTILKFDKDLTYALLAGFIDGDGNIKNQTNRKDFILQIKNHSSWRPILIEFSNLISKKDFTRINSSGYATLIISNTEDLKKLKKKILSLNLPIMSRKWDIIDLNFVSKYVTAKELRDNVINAYKLGLKNKDISIKFNTSPANVTRIIKNYKNGT